MQQGAIDEMNTVIDTFRKENKDSVVILCGGDYNFFDKHLKNSIFADPFIVLKGLNIILEFNAKITKFYLFLLFFCEGSVLPKTKQIHHIPVLVLEICNLISYQNMRQWEALLLEVIIPIL